MGALREILGTRGQWLFYLGVSTGVGVLMALTGAFGSYDQPLTSRFAYGLAMSWIAAPVFILGMRALLTGFDRTPLHRWAAEPLAALIANVALTGVVVVISRWMQPQDPGPGLVRLYFNVAVLALPVSLGTIWIMRLRDRANAAAAPPREPTDAPPRLLARVPGKLGEEIVALEAEDHYVRVHTALGSALVLMRLSDAIEELDGLAGARTHRSWWVATRGVEKAEKGGGTATLTLKGGLTAPVSRSAMAQARAARLVV